MDAVPDEAPCEPSLDPAPARAGEPILHVVLIEPEIAANTGSIGRTCVALGARLWVVRPLGFRLGDRERRRAGLDYWQHLDLRVVDSFDEVEHALGPDKLWLFSTRASRTYTDARFQRGDALVFGPESRGIGPALLHAYRDRSVRIPLRSKARSLNLACAAAVAAYEAARQIGFDPDREAHVKPQAEAI